MTKRIDQAYPFLFAVIPVLRLVAAYPGWAEWADVAVILATVVAACGVVYGLALLGARRWGASGRLAALILMAAVLGFWIYPRMAMLLDRRAGLSHPVLLPLWAGAAVGIIWWLARRPTLLDVAESFLTRTSGLLVAWFVLSIGVNAWRSAGSVERSTLVRRLADPIPVQPSPRHGPKRDIYLIVLDEYANADVTGWLFGFDNHAFLDSLRQLGFVVPAVHSNYLHTFLSLPSLLNAAHVADLSAEIGSMSVDRTVPDYLVEHNRTVRFLKSQGYKFAFFPSLSWGATRHSADSDLELDASHGANPARGWTHSGLPHVLYKTSLLRYIDLGGRPDMRAHLKRTFAAMAQVPKIPGPVLAFAHVMSPHDPYIFDRRCRPVTWSPGRGTRLELTGAPYVEQVECLNRMLLTLVTELLRTSEPPPIILLQGDHGSKALVFDQAEAAEKITLAAAQERLGAFGAYYLPDRGSEAFGDSVTVVNVMGDVLRFYFGAALPRTSDDMYLSVDRAPYAFKRVDFAWLAGEHRSVPSGKKAAGR
jgi:hypothetical protein